MVRAVWLALRACVVRTVHDHRPQPVALTATTMAAGFKPERLRSPGGETAQPLQVFCRYALVANSTNGESVWLPFHGVIGATINGDPSARTMQR